jgi:hypothetical protein
MWINTAYSPLFYNYHLSNTLHLNNYIYDWRTHTRVFDLLGFVITFIVSIY